MESIRIFCRYEGFGWVAKAPAHSPLKTGRCTGPKAAATELADKIFGVGKYELQRKFHRIYVATPIQAKTSDCPVCHGFKWVCENHQDKPWNEEGCECGAGAPCKCNPNGEPMPGSTNVPLAPLRFEFGVQAKTSDCPVCHGFKWVCEDHKDKPWNEDGCMCGAGAPCVCNPQGEPMPGNTSVLSVPLRFEFGVSSHAKTKRFQDYVRRNTSTSN